MIDPGNRFYAPHGAIFPGGPSTWYVVDWDQRRWVSVTLDGELDSEEPAYEQLTKYIDDLAPDVYAIHVAPDGTLKSISTDPEDDETRCSFRPLLETISRPESVPVIKRTDLQEIDRVTANVDLVLNLQSKDPTQKLIFKYYFVSQHLSFNWHEMNLWMRLPRHPNIVPFDSIVVDELEGRFVGFTSVFIPGGTLNDTLSESRSRPFKIKYLQQLIHVVDELNLKLGIAHQDVAPRNLVIDEATDNLMLFDFNFSARVGTYFFQEARNDIKGVLFTLHEIITRTNDYRDVRHEDQDVSAIEHEEWVKHPDVILDQPLAKFRQVVRDWCERRRNGQQITHYKDAPHFLDWPPLPDPPPPGIPIVTPSGPDTMVAKLYDWKRTELKAEGKAVLEWQRLPQNIKHEDCDKGSREIKTKAPSSNSGEARESGETKVSGVTSPEETNKPREDTLTAE